MEAEESDVRDVTLSVDLEHVEVREVKAVVFTTSDYEVSRVRWSHKQHPF
jgi:hypothetical protein